MFFQAINVAVIQLHTQGSEQTEGYIYLEFYTHGHTALCNILGSF